MDRRNARIKWINAALLLFSLIGYLEWGGHQSAFLGTTEYQLLVHPGSGSAFFHPLIFLPMAGQLILLFTLFQRKVSWLLSMAGMGFLLLLFAIVLLAGALSFNMKIIASVIPFLFCSILLWRTRPKTTRVT